MSDKNLRIGSFDLTAVHMKQSKPIRENRSMIEEEKRRLLRYIERSLTKASMLYRIGLPEGDRKREGECWAEFEGLNDAAEPLREELGVTEPRYLP